MEHFVPPTITPPPVPLNIFDSVRQVRRNALNILPAIAYTQPIVSGKTGPARWHMVQGPEGMRRVFKDNAENYPKNEVMIRMLKPAVGKSLFTSEGADWRWQRRAIAPVFTARNVDALAPVMTRTAERATARLAEGGRREMVREMLSATFDVICEVALSGREHFDADRYGEAITRYFLTVGRASLLDFLEVPQWIPRPGAILGAGAVRTMHEMVSRAIDERRRTGPAGDRDLLDYMIDAEDPETGQRMTERDLLHNMQFFIVAGHETTALALSWALYMLSHDEAVQARVRDEARGVLGDRAATAADLKALPAVEAVIEESMRLYPPVGLLARTAIEADTLYDRAVAPGETVFLNMYSMHRHQMYWEHPDAFHPDHFTEEAKRARDKFQYVPFGAGPRICVGANFAMMQAQIILATLLARFRFLPAGPHPEPVMHMTLRPEPGVQLAVEPIGANLRKSA